MLHNNFVGLLQIRQIQCNSIRVIIFITQKFVGYFTMKINDLETFYNELYLFIHLIVQNVQFPSQITILYYLNFPVVAFLL